MKTPVDLRLVFLHRCAAQLHMIESGVTDLDEAWADIAETFLQVPSEFTLLERHCELNDEVPF